MRRAAAVTIALLVVGGCAVRADRSIEHIDDHSVPFGLLDPKAPAVVAVNGGRTVSVCLLKEDKLAVVSRKLPNDAGLLDVASALSALTDAEAETGLQTKLTGPDEIRSVTLQAGTASVDFAKTSEQTLTADPLATIAQLVCTLTAQPGVGLVAFTVNGLAIEVPRADGSLSDQPVTRDDYRPLFEPSG